MMLPNGQPVWQKGTPQSMHRAPCVRSSSLGRIVRNSLIVLDALVHRLFAAGLARVFHETADFTHLQSTPTLNTGLVPSTRRGGKLVLALELLFGALFQFGQRTLVIGGHDLDELRRQVVPVVEHALAHRAVR